MRSPFPQFLAFLALFVLLSCFGLAQEEQDSERSQRQASHLKDNFAGEERHPGAPPIRFASKIDEEHGQGAAALDKAVSILRAIEPHRIRRARTEHPSGFLQTSFYYSKRLFTLLFMNGPSQQEPSDTTGDSPALSQPLSEAVELLELAYLNGYDDAAWLLAEMNFFGNYTHPRNYPEAFRRYEEFAALTGNGSAQHMVGFIYATGIGGAVERDQARANLYYTFAAHNGDTRSQMALAFRYHTGIATPRNCEEAVNYYRKVADKAIQFSRSGPPGGQTLVKEAYRLSDDEGGTYGEGASVSSSGINARHGGPNSESHASLDDVLEYLDLMSRKGDLKATFALGRLHYEGSRALTRNLKMARKYFTRVTKRYWGKDGRAISGVAPGTDKLASKAAGYIGRMSLRGEGVEENFEKAMLWFRRGIENGDALSQYGIGLMYLEGHGVPKDAVRAADYFKAAADQDFPSAQVRLGTLFLDQGDLTAAIRYFELAARHGHIEAFYYLAEIINQGLGKDRSCGMAAAYYKIVAEKAEALHSSFVEANEAYEDGDSQTALVLYLMAAEQGYEAAQANVAYILDEHKSYFSIDWLQLFDKMSRPSFLRNAGLALIHWTRSAKQSNIDSMVKMGDYYLDGFGADADHDKAAVCYQSAAEFQQSAQALWNLGWMHENGIGVEQDFHLAKRFYDQALESSPEAYLPVKLSLLKLRARSFWNTITNGQVNSIHSEPEPKKDWSFSEWVQSFLEDDDEHPYYRDTVDEDDDLTTPKTHSKMPGGDDYYEDEIDEGMLESLIIIALAASLAFLLYYRQQRQLQHRRAVQIQQQQQQQQAQGEAGVAGAAPVPQQPEADRGFFPQPGDPDFNQWVAGGIGH